MYYGLWTDFNTLSRSLVLLISFRSLTKIKIFDNLRESIGCVDFYLNRNLIKTVVVFFLEGVDLEMHAHVIFTFSRLRS